jgi:cytochrome c peroxidase
MRSMRTLRNIVICVAAIVLIVTGIATANMLTPTEQLGKSIFFDMNLSIEKNQSCAACHALEVGWTGPDSEINAGGSVYEGSIPGRFGNRKPPSSGYATFSPILLVDKKGSFIGGNFWDGRATGERLGNPAADQAQGPFLNPAEQALPDSACVVYRVCNPVVPGDYPASFEDVWGAGACDIDWPMDIDLQCSMEEGMVILTPDDRNKSDTAYDNIARSIADYEASPEVNAFTSKYDYSLRGMAQLSRQERRGFALFNGKGKCRLCHLINGMKPLFTDFTYDNLGVPKNLDNPFYNVEPDFIDFGLGGFLATRDDYKDLAQENNGKHKVPTLRNVAKGSCEAEPNNPNCIVKAYGHNGYFKSLWQIVHFYNTRDVKDTCPDPFTRVEDAIAEENDCWPEPEVSENLNTDELGDLGLTFEEEMAIVKFMQTLSDGFVPME